MAFEKIRSKGVFGGHEIIRVTSGSSVPHLGHFLNMIHSRRNDRSGNGDIQNKVTLEKLDLTNRPSLEKLFPCVGPTSMLGLKAWSLWWVLWLVGYRRYGRNMVLRS